MQQRSSVRQVLDRASGFTCLCIGQPQSRWREGKKKSPKGNCDPGLGIVVMEDGDGRSGPQNANANAGWLVSRQAGGQAGKHENGTGHGHGHGRIGQRLLALQNMVQARKIWLGSRTGIDLHTYHLRLSPSSCFFFPLRWWHLAASLGQ